MGWEGAMSQAMIQVEDLMKSFRDLRRGRVNAVDGVSFTARPG